MRLYKCGINLETLNFVVDSKLLGGSRAAGEDVQCLHVGERE